MSQLQPSDNPVATALVIAYNLQTTWGTDNADPKKIAADVNKLAHALLDGMGISQLHGPK